LFQDVTARLCSHGQLVISDGPTRQRSEHGIGTLTIPSNRHRCFRGAAVSRDVLKVQGRSTYTGGAWREGRKNSNFTCCRTMTALPHTNGAGKETVVRVSRLLPYRFIRRAKSRSTSFKTPERPRVRSGPPKNSTPGHSMRRSMWCTIGEVAADQSTKNGRTRDKAAACTGAFAITFRRLRRTACWGYRPKMSNKCREILSGRRSRRAA